MAAVHELFTAQVGATLAASAHLQVETLKPLILVETAFGLVAEQDGKVHGTASILMEQETPETVVGMLCRLAVLDDADRLATAANLVGTAVHSLEGNMQLCLAEIPSADSWAQVACEQCGFVPCGYLPQKFQAEARCSAVVYTHLSAQARNLRRPHPGIISAARDLATEALKAHGIIEDAETREDAVAYPTECNFTFAPIDADAVATMNQSMVVQQNEIFPSLQGTQTRLSFPAPAAQHIVARDGDRVVGFISYILDPFDRRVQITGVTALAGEPQGYLIANMLESVTNEFSPDYWEVVVSAHAPRLQKTFDQVGFVPCAYLPAYGVEQGMRADAIKMVKLNAAYESDPAELTNIGKNMFNIVDTIFREHSVGTAVLKLLRDLRIFQGLGEGELRRVARLFSQKLFRPGEVVFEEGTTGQELYVVERGEIEIRTKMGDQLLGTIRNGAALGEIAFLNNEPRTARGVSKSATIVRVIHRSDFDRLIQREMHLGLMFFQNVALDLADKLKQSNLQARSKSSA